MKNRIVVIGGFVTDAKNSNDAKLNIEYFDGKNWTLGPKIPFGIHSGNSQIIQDRMGRVLVLSNNNGLILYDSKLETFKQYEDFGLKERRHDFSALLQ